MHQHMAALFIVFHVFQFGTVRTYHQHIHTLFAQVREVPFAAGAIDVPVLSTIDWAALALAVGAIVAMFRFNARMLPVLGACAALGATYVLIN